jgi:uncharacterized iron-regulated membrane protein
MGARAGFGSHPQSVWLRRALFQVHLWLGLAIGLYILVISVSGSLIVFRRELDRALCPGTLVVTPSGRRFIAVCEPAFVTWVAEFHDHLGGGRTGLLVNGLGAVAITVMCVTGAVIWWPGRKRWRRSLTLHRGVGSRRLIWDLHSVLGFWLLLLVLMWSVTGIYFAFPALFNALDDDATALLVRLHFGRAFGPAIETLWVLLGLVPCGLFITGALMWWNRVLRPRMAANGRPRQAENLDPISGQ